MKNQPFLEFRKKLNIQIAKKSRIDRGGEMEQSRIKFHKIGKVFPNDLLNTLDYDFSHLTHHKKIELDQTYSISLFTYSQQFYCLEMVNYVFPMKVLVTNVRQDGMLYIGYDQEYPGISRENTSSIFQSGAGQSKTNYDFKSVIDKDMLITLKSKGNRIVKYVYFTFVAGPSLLLFDFKVQFIGFDKNKRNFSESVLKKQPKNTSVIDSKTINGLVRQKTEPTKRFQRSKLPQLKNQKMVSLQQFQVFTDQILGKRSSKAGQSIKQGSNQQATIYNNPLTHRKRSRSQQFFKMAKDPLNGNVPRSDLVLKMEQVKRNKQMYEIYLVKDKELKQTASKCKRLIEEYKKIHNEENVRRRRINKNLSTTIFSILYVSQIHTKYLAKVRWAKIQFKVAYLCKKFVKKLKRKYQQSCKLIPYRYRRVTAEEIAAVTLQSKSIYRHSTLRSQKICQQTLSFLTPLLTLRNSVSSCIVFRDKVMLIQKYWKVKYYSRINCILHFIDKHLQKTFTQYPHFLMFKNQFYGANLHLELCLKYIKDESEKYRIIYAAYLKKLKDINQMQQVNISIAKENPSMKSRLNLPKQPLKPIHRFYRNLDILRSMIRTWFEIQHKKHIKKNSQRTLK